MDRNAIRRAVLALAPVLGWTVDTSGKAWTVERPECYRGLSFAPVALLCSMLRVAVSPVHVDGRSMNRESLDALLGPVNAIPRSVPGKASATDEATLLRIWPELSP
jgi:hypothetical protein